MAGAVNITRPNRPIAVPRFSIGKAVNMTFISNGIIIADPDAWTILATTSKPNPGARTASAVPTVNSDIATKNTRRFVNFWIKNALAGIKIPLTSINPVVNHWTEDGATSNSTIIVGNAIFNNVLFNNSNNTTIKRIT